MNEEPVSSGYSADSEKGLNPTKTGGSKLEGKMKPGKARNFTLVMLNLDSSPG